MVVLNDGSIPMTCFNVSVSVIGLGEWDFTSCTSSCQSS